MMKSQCAGLAAEMVRSWRRLAVSWLLVAGVVGLSVTSALAQAPGAVLTRLVTLPSDEGNFTELILGQDGNLYGTTYNATLDTGTVFKATRDGTLTTLQQFTGTDAAQPANLFQATDGNFYGLAYHTHGTPSIFRLTPDGTLTTRFVFPANRGGGSLLLATDGNFYGLGGPLPAATRAGRAGPSFE